MKKLKVFHGLVNYGTQAGLFAKELRNQGINAFSATTPDRFKRQIDIELLHGGCTIVKIFKHTYNWMRRFFWFFRYNLFHFYYGTNLLPIWMGLKPYKWFGKKVIMHYLGADVMDFTIPASRYNLEQNHRFITHAKKKALLLKSRLNYELKNTCLRFVCAPVYSEYAPDSSVIPLAIDLDLFSYSPAKRRDKLVIMHAPTDRIFKGTAYIVDAVNKLSNQGFPIELDLVEGVTHSELLNRYKNCDIFIDQISVGWYGTAAIEAMAIGRPTVCFIDPLYFQYVDYGESMPIINASKENIYTVLKDTIQNREELINIGQRSRQFVEEVHDVKRLTKRLISIYGEL